MEVFIILAPKTSKSKAGAVAEENTPYVQWPICKFLDDALGNIIRNTFHLLLRQEAGFIKYGDYILLMEFLIKSKEKFE